MLGDSSRRGVVLSTTSTVVVLAVLVGIFLLAPGSAQVRHTFFNPTDMWQVLRRRPEGRLLLGRRGAVAEHQDVQSRPRS
jgi:hypothetical protein